MQPACPGDQRQTRITQVWKRAKAQKIEEIGREEYNRYQPHSSLGYLTLVEYAGRYCDLPQRATVAQPQARAGTLSA